MFLPFARELLYRDVSIDFGAVQKLRSYFDGESVSLTPAMVANLFEHTRKLRLIEAQHWQSGHPELQHLRFAAILQACNPNKVKTLELSFNRTHYTGEIDRALIEIFGRHKFRCSEMTLISCSDTLLAFLVEQNYEDLRRLTCYFEWDMSTGNSDSPRLQTPLPNLITLDLSMDHKHLALVSDIIERAASRLQGLDLRMRFQSIPFLNPPPPSRTYHFNTLRKLSCFNLTGELFTSIITNCPKLRSLHIGGMQRFRGSLLALIPPSVEDLIIDEMTTEQDPFHTLLDRLSLLTELKHYPRLEYRHLSKEELPFFDSARTDVLAHFENRGMRAFLETWDQCLYS